MRSALKVPGTPGRFIDPRSPTFKEEKALEEREAKTEVQNAKDIVGFGNLQAYEDMLTISTESQDPSQDSKAFPSRRQFQL